MYKPITVKFDRRHNVFRVNAGNRRLTDVEVPRGVNKEIVCTWDDVVYHVHISYIDFGDAFYVVKPEPYDYSGRIGM